MMELIGKLPVFVQIVVGVVVIFGTLLSIAYLLLALRDSIEENRRDQERERRRKQQLYEAVLRIAHGCERIADILTTTEVLSTVEVTVEDSDDEEDDADFPYQDEEGAIHYD